MSSVPVDLVAYMDRIRPVVDETLARLAGTKFRLDPIGGKKFSRATSIISSAYKRHGHILSRALLERLKDCSRLHVWTEDAFKLSQSSLTEVQADLPENQYRARKLPYGDAEKTIGIDLLVFDQTTGKLTSYNVKRGNGRYDAGKKRQLMNELLRTRLLLSGYATSVGRNPVSLDAKVIFYYGVTSLPNLYCVCGDELDLHFEFPVQRAVECCNEYFQLRLFDLIENHS